MQYNAAAMSSGVVLFTMNVFSQIEKYFPVESTTIC